MQSTDQISRTLMPNTYVRLLAQEFPQVDKITAGTGISAQELAEYPYPVTVRQHLTCIENVIPLRPHLDWHLRWGKRMAENFHGAVTLAWLTAPTLGAGLDTFIRYMPARVPYLNWRGEVDGNTFRCSVKPNIDLGPVRQMLTEVPLIVMHEYVRVVRHGPVTDAHIELTYPPPEHAHLYDRWFDCPVQFECDDNAMIIPSKWRDIANLDFDEAAWQTSIARCEAMSQIDEERDLITRVRQLLLQALDQPGSSRLLSLNEVAQQLHLSPRTVIRRLRAQDLSFQQITDEILQARARTMLTDSSRSIQDIAAELGYCDSASFRKAFRRWFNTTPSQFRAGIETETALTQAQSS